LLGVGGMKRKIAKDFALWTTKPTVCRMFFLRLWAVEIVILLQQAFKQDMGAHKQFI
jgi:hypothetical protein